MLTKARIEKFYADLEALGLLRPVAEIAKATGYSKGNVSEWLNRKKEPSENFIEKFYQEFYKGSFNKSVTNLDSSQPTSDLPADTKALYERWLADKDKTQQQFHETNQGLIDLLKNKLDEIATNLMTGQLQLKEQLFAVNENLDQQLEGISRGLAAKDKKVVKRGTSVSARQRDGDGKGKIH